MFTKIFIQFVHKKSSLAMELKEKENMKHVQIQKGPPMERSNC